jgi:hypothetical protein
MNIKTFEVDAGKTVTQGKPDWPDGVRLQMSRKRAMEIMADLAVALCNEERDEFSVFLTGVLSEEPEE